MVPELPLAVHQQNIADIVEQSHRRLMQEGRCCPETLHTLVSACLAAELFSQAKGLLLEILALEPNDSLALFHLGLACQSLGLLAEAIDAYKKSLALNPDQASVHFRLGTLYRKLGSYAEASVFLKRACLLDPQHEETRFEQALLDLVQGDLLHGFQGYEYRWDESMKRLISKTSAPLWLGGEAIEGKTILLHEEQGLGDTMQFVRYLPSVVAMGARALLKVQPALKRLMKLSFPGIPVFSSWDEVPAHDYHCPLPSLPLACQPWLRDKIPHHVPYLRTEAPRIEYWKQRLTGDARLRAGIVWAGNPIFPGDASRSIPLVAFGEMIRQLPCRVIRVQKELRPGNRGELDGSCRMEEFEDAFDDFTETAALIENLDLLITVDTCSAHLAGALGKPFWLLVPHVPDWRWGLDRVDSGWYPTARLFRQGPNEDWRDLLARVTDELIRLSATREIGKLVT